MCVTDSLSWVQPSEDVTLSKALFRIQGGEMQGKHRTFVVPRQWKQCWIRTDNNRRTPFCPKVTVVLDVLLEVVCTPSCRLSCVTVMGAELSLRRGPVVSMLAVSVVRMCSYLFCFCSVLGIICLRWLCLWLLQSAPLLLLSPQLWHCLRCGFSTCGEAFSV